MGLDLGSISVSLDLETRDFDAKIDSAGAAAAELQKQLQDASNTKVSVKPEGVGELKNAAQSAEATAGALEHAGKAAAGVKPPKGLQQGMRDAAAAADGTEKALGKVSAQAKQARLNPALKAELDSAARSAEGLSESMHFLSGGGMGMSMGGLASAASKLGAGLTVAAAGGAVFTKGMARLTAIDSAKAKLKGLGHDAEGITEIMANASQAVMGTAFGLGEAASTAATAVAAGIKPGEDLARTLTTIADTAAIAGSGMGEMGMIFNSVAARGKLQGDDMLQLLGRGIPVLSLLADQLGLTSAEVSKMVSDGKIDFETFQAAMESGMGGAAKAMGDTFEGAMKNTGAAVGRLGEALLNPIFQQAPGVLGSITDAVNALTSVAKPAAAAFSDLPGPVKTAATHLTMAATAMALFRRASENQDGTLGKMTNSTKAWSTQVKVAAAELQASNAGLSRHRALAMAAANTSPRVKSLAMAYQEAAASARASGNAAGEAQLKTRLMGVAAGSAAVGMRGLQAAASAAWAAIGGPVGLAITGVTLALGAFMSHAEKTKQRQQELADQTRAMADAFAESGGAITKSMQDGFVDDAINSDMKKIADTGLATIAEMVHAAEQGGDAYTKLRDSIQEVADKHEQAANNLRAGNMIGAAREEQEKADAIKAGLEALDQQKDVIHDGAQTAREAAQAKAELAAEDKKVAEAAGLGAESYSALGEMLGIFGGEAKSAKEQLNVLKTAILAFNGDTDAAMRQAVSNAEDAIHSFVETVNGVQLKFADDGKLDLADEASRKVEKQIVAFRDAMAEVGAQALQDGMEHGLDLGESTRLAQQMIEERRQSLIDEAVAAGQDREQIEQLLNTYNAFPEEVLTQVQADISDNAKEVMSKVGRFKTELDEEKLELKVEADPDSFEKSRADIEALGMEITGSDGKYTIKPKVDNEQAELAMREIARHYADSKGEVEDNPAQIKADTQQALAQLEELGYKAEALPVAELKLTDNTEEIRGKLDALGIAYEELDDKTIHITDNAPDVEKRVKDAGIALDGLEGGNIVISDNAGEVKSALDALGVKTTQLPEGNIVIRENASEVGERVRSKLDANLKNLVYNVRVQTTETVRRIFGRSGGGDKHATGGRIGGHAGYRLPTTGPGTERRDGFLGVDSEGVPVTWVDRGEWVTNAMRSAQYDRTLAAINTGGPTDILRALMSELPQHAKGGKVGAEHVVDALAPYANTPYILGGFTPAGTDCSGAVSMAANVVDGRAPYDGRGATANMREFLKSRGFVDGLGGPDDMSVGWYHNSGVDGHTAATVGGHHIESGGGTGQGLTIDGPAAGADSPQFTQHMHRPLEQTGDAGDFDLGSSELSSVSHALGGLTGASSSVGGYGGRAAISTVGDFIGGADSPLAQQLSKLAYEGVSGADVLKQAFPEGELVLKLSPEATEAFEKIAEGRRKYEEATQSIIDAEEALVEARENAGDAESDYAERVQDARDALEQAQQRQAKGEGDAGKNAQAVDKAQQKLNKLLRDQPKAAKKAADTVAKAEANLAKARGQQRLALESITDAQAAYILELVKIPLKVFDTAASLLVSSMDAVAERVARLTALHEAYGDAQQARVDAELKLLDAQMKTTAQLRAGADLHRQVREKRVDDDLAVEQAEWDLSKAQSEARALSTAAAHGALIADEERAESIKQVMMLQTAVDLARAERAFNEFENAAELADASFDLEEAQINAAVAARELEIATTHLAASQQGVRSNAVKTQLEAEGRKSASITGMVRSGLEILGGALLAPATGGASLLLAAKGIAGMMNAAAEHRTAQATLDANRDAYAKQLDGMTDEQRAAVRKAIIGAKAGTAVGSLTSVFKDDLGSQLGQAIAKASAAELDAMLAALETKQRNADEEKAEAQRQLRLEEAQKRRELAAKRREALDGRLGEHNRLADIVTELRIKNKRDKFKDQLDKADKLSSSKMLHIGGGRTFDKDAPAWRVLQQVGGFGGVQLGIAEAMSSWLVSDGSKAGAAPRGAQAAVVQAREQADVEAALRELNTTARVLLTTVRDKAPAVVKQGATFNAPVTVNSPQAAGASIEEELARALTRA